MASKRPATVASAGDPVPQLSRAELLASIFGTGAAVMVIEILGTRIIGPVFGVNLFIWAALLTVTLAPLAAGYYFGGVLVDCRPNARLLNLVIVVAGALARQAMSAPKRPPVRLAEIVALLSLGTDLGLGQPIVTPTESTLCR